MRTIEVRLSLPDAELLDASDDLEELLGGREADDLSPAGRTLLLALDDAIADAFVPARETLRPETG